MLSETSQAEKDKYCLISHIFRIDGEAGVEQLRLKKKQKTKTVKKWLPGAGGNRERLVKGYKLSAIQ